MQVGILVGTAGGAADGHYQGGKLGPAAGLLPTAAVTFPVGAAQHGAGRTVDGPRLDPVQREERRKSS